MKTKEGFFKKKLLSIATRIGNNKIILSISDGIIINTPLIIVGSLFLVIANFPIEYFRNLLIDLGLTEYFLKGADSSFGLMGLVSSYGIAHNLAKRYKLDAVSAGIISLSSFFIVTSFIEVNGVVSIPLSYMGSSGLFVAIIISVISTLIFKKVTKSNRMKKLANEIPPTISRNFSSLVSGVIIISFWLTIFILIDKSGLGSIHNIIGSFIEEPLRSLSGNVFGTIVGVTLNGLFWMVGVHGGNLVNGALIPVWLINSDENRIAFQAGASELPHIITKQFIDSFIFIGGAGATLGLAIAIFIISKKKNSSRLTKSMVSLSITPSLLNVNEPLLFGIPIVMNMSLFIPFIIVPIINLLIAYFAMSTGLVPKTIGVSVTWTMPPIISGFIVTNSIRGAILQIVCIAVDTIIYGAFYKKVEEKKIKLESKYIEI